MESLPELENSLNSKVSELETAKLEIVGFSFNKLELLLEMPLKKEDKCLMLSEKAWNTVS